jgi:hypothetical protein
MSINAYHTITRFRTHGYFRRRFKKAYRAGYCQPEKFFFNNDRDFFNYVLSRCLAKTCLLVLDRTVDSVYTDGVYTSSGFELIKKSPREILLRDHKKRSIKIVLTKVLHPDIL